VENFKCKDFVSDCTMITKQEEELTEEAFFLFGRRGPNETPMQAICF
jgi:hypothetical protein